MSVEAWIIEEREKEERRRREEEAKSGIHLPRTPHELDPDDASEQRQGKGGRVQVVEISPRPDNVIEI